MEDLIDTPQLCCGELHWLENSAALQEEDNFSVIFRDLLGDVHDIWGEGQPEKDKKRKMIISRIEKLEVFADLNQHLLTEYRAQLEKCK